MTVYTVKYPQSPSAGTLFQYPPNNGTSGYVLQTDGFGVTSWVAAGSGSSAFNAITSGTNTTAAMVVGTGASLAASGSGTITATAVPVGGVSGLGTGVATALAVNTGSSGAFVVNGGALGTPSSGTATNLTGTAAGLTAGSVTNATFTTALTVNTGTLTLTANAANNSVLTIGAGAVSVSGTNTGDQTSVSGNAGTATALQNARTIGGVSFDGTANIVPQTIQIVDAASDTTTFLMLATSATGSLQPATDAGLSYNASTNALTTTTFIGALTGNASTATTLENGRTIAITGDLTYTSPSFNGSGNVTAAGTLATVNSNVGSFGSSTSIPSFTVNGKGLITAASGNAVIAPAGTLTGSTLAAGVTASSLTSVGTIGTGTWQGSIVTGTYGGTGVNNASRTITYGGNVTFSGAFTFTGTVTANTTVTFPTTGTLATLAGTETYTNKRITKRTGTVASSATPTINTDNVDFYSITALAVNITSFTTNLSGTPTEGQTLWIAITDNGSARTLAWGASFQASTVALPTATVASTRLDVGFVWAGSIWRCVAVA